RASRATRLRQPASEEAVVTQTASSTSSTDPAAARPASEGAALLERLHLSALDLRLAIMAGVLVVMAVVFHALTGGFLPPENLHNIVQQTAGTGIVATAVSLVIVARHIDLSVGSVLGFVGVLIAWLMYTQNWPWPAACAVGLLV